MAQLPDPTPNLDDEGRAIYQRLAGPRGGLHGMYLALMNNPLLAEQIGNLGSYLRFQGLLSADVRELAILATARGLGVAYEWEQHAPIALAAGVPQAVVSALQAGDFAAPSMSALYSDICSAARHVVAQESIPDELQQRLEQALGLKGVVELVALCGFYRCIATVVTAFDVALPNPGPPPF
jgi:4-carboxymuconolactone decarboxylase